LPGVDALPGLLYYSQPKAWGLVETMPGQGVELQVLDGCAWIAGECDIDTVARIDGWLGRFDEGPLVVDMSGVTFLDAAGLRTLLLARRRNPGLRVVNPSHAVQRVLDITGTHAYLVDDTDPLPG
jgi:anti-anti-sigma factor